MSTAQQDQRATLDRIIQDRIASAHLYRCLVQGHHGDPCVFCGVSQPVSGDLSASITVGSTAPLP